MIKMSFLLFVAAVFFVNGCSNQQKSDDSLAQYRQFMEPGDHEVYTGDLIEIAVVTSSSEGPSTLEVKITGNTNSIQKIPKVFLVPPSYLDFDNPKAESSRAQLRVYFIASRPGDVTITVTPAFDNTQTDRKITSLVYQVSVKDKVNW